MLHSLGRQEDPEESLRGGEALGQFRPGPFFRPLCSVSQCKDKFTCLTMESEYLTTNYFRVKETVT